MDAGYFGPDSVAWRIHADPVMLVGGMRALLLQALEPRAMAAVEQHSSYRDDPWGRLERTRNYILRTTFGDTATADAAAAHVRGVHARVRGVDPVTGLEYAADDPDLLLWVHAVEVESFLTAYRAYAARVSGEDADRYVAEMARAAELVGLPRSMAPRTAGELRDYLEGMPGLRMTESARAVLRVVFLPPMPLHLRPLWAVPATATLAILPGYARSMYGLPWFGPATMPVRANVFAITRVVKLLRPPPPLVREAHARAEAVSAA